MKTMRRSRTIREASPEYGLLNHYPSGEVYVMRFHDGAVSGPYHRSEHLEALANAAALNYDPDLAAWGKEQAWQHHNVNFLGTTCDSCNT